MGVSAIIFKGAPRIPSISRSYSSARPRFIPQCTLGGQRSLRKKNRVNLYRRTPQKVSYPCIARLSWGVERQETKPRGLILKVPLRLGGDFPTKITRGTGTQKITHTPSGKFFSSKTGGERRKREQKKRPSDASIYHGKISTMMPAKVRMHPDTLRGFLTPKLVRKRTLMASKKSGRSRPDEKSHDILNARKVLHENCAKKHTWYEIRTILG